MDEAIIAKAVGVTFAGTAYHTGLNISHESVSKLFAGGGDTVSRNTHIEFEPVF